MPPFPVRALRRAAVILAMGALIPSAVRAQIQPGAHVRILAPSAADSLITGTVLEIGSSSLLLAPAASAPSRAVPLSAIERLEVRRRGRPRTFNGGAIGFLLGAGAGYVLTHAYVRNSDCEYICGAVQAGGSIAGAIGGMGVGSIIGSRYRDPDRWEPVHVPAGRTQP